LTIGDRQSKIVKLNYREAAGAPMKHFFFSILLIVGLTSGVLAQQEIVPAASTALYELVLEYNDVLDTCTRTGCTNIDELMEFFADDAVRTFVGRATQVGKEAIRNSYLQRAQRLQQVVEVKGIDVWGDLVVCRLERRDTTHTQTGMEHHVRVFLVKGGKIKQLVIVVDPEEDARLRSAEGS
jgi:hypothetical protein